MGAILTLLQAAIASVIAPPVSLDPSAIRIAPTTAARALSMAAVDQLPPTPVTVTLQCLVDADGRLADCIPADDGGTGDIAVFRQRLFAGVERAKADPILAAALARTPFYRVRLSHVVNKATTSVLVREVVSAADRPPPDASRGTIGKGELRIDPDPAVSISAFYPPAALRAGAQTRVTATCRVLGDHSLLCRDPQVDLPPIVGDLLPLWRIPALDPDFGRATVRAFATMRAQPQTASGEDSIGHEVLPSIAWRLP